MNNHITIFHSSRVVRIATAIRSRELTTITPLPTTPGSWQQGRETVGGLVQLFGAS